MPYGIWPDLSDPFLFLSSAESNTLDIVLLCKNKYQQRRYRSNNGSSHQRPVHRIILILETIIGHIKLFQPDWNVIIPSVIAAGRINGR